MISKDQIVSSSFVRYGALPLGLIALVVVLRIFFFTPFRVMTTAQAVKAPAARHARKTAATGAIASIETTFRNAARGIPVRRMRPKARRRWMTEEIAETVRETAESKAAITIPT